jgi:hypothetical protein
MLNNKHEPSIPQNEVFVIGGNADTTHYALPRCQGKENGIPCWRHAEIPYQTAAWPGHWEGGEIVWLCKQCDEQMWKYIFHIKIQRMITDLLDEDGKEIVA